MSYVYAHPWLVTPLPENHHTAIITHHINSTMFLEQHYTKKNLFQPHCKAFIYVIMEIAHNSPVSYWLCQ